MCELCINNSKEYVQTTTTFNHHYTLRSESSLDRICGGQEKELRPYIRHLSIHFIHQQPTNNLAYNAYPSKLAAACIWILYAALFCNILSCA